MKKMWQFYRRKVNLYLLLGFLSLAFVTITFKLGHIFFLVALFTLTIIPIIVNFIVDLRENKVSAKRSKKQENFAKIPHRCRQCRWYYGKVDRRYRFLCLISARLKNNCVDFQK